MVTRKHVLAYIAIFTAVPMLAALGQQLAIGAVPIPPVWAWVIPILIAGITALTMILPGVVTKPPGLPTPGPIDTGPINPTPVPVAPKSPSASSLPATASAPGGMTTTTSNG